MGKVETIGEFYKRKFDWIPDNLRNEIGHINAWAFRFQLWKFNKIVATRHACR